MYCSALFFPYFLSQIYVFHLVEHLDASFVFNYRLEVMNVHCYVIFECFAFPSKFMLLIKFMLKSRFEMDTFLCGAWLVLKCFLEVLLVVFKSLKILNWIFFSLSFIYVILCMPILWPCCMDPLWSRFFYGDGHFIFFLHLYSRLYVDC